jgi:hypothetical protein
MRPVEVQTHRVLVGGEAFGIALELIPGAYARDRRSKSYAGNVVVLDGVVVIRRTPGRA